MQIWFGTHFHGKAQFSLLNWSLTYITTGPTYNHAMWHTHTHTAHNMRVFQAELGHRGFPARLRWSGDGDACTTVNTYLFIVHSSACSISLWFKVVCLYFMYCYGVIPEMRRLCLQTVVPSGCAGNPVFMGSFALSGWVGSISELAV